MNIEQKILSFEEDNTVIGIGNADPFYYMIPILEKTKVPFVSYDIQKRIDPSLTKKDVKSIIALCLSYNKKFIGKMDNKIRGNMSIGAMGTDYHILVRKKLENIRDSLNIDGDIYVDTGALVDREVAKRCGLCVTGKSQNVINKKLGSIIYIGYMLSSLKLNPTNSDILKNPCENCDKCIKACPTNAITNDGFIYERCISYLTQKKELQTDWEKQAIGKQIYGCDICQRVCPHNKGVYADNIYDIEVFYPDIQKLLFMSNKEFSETYKEQACGWRGKKILQRNAILSLSNLKNPNDKAIQMLEKMLKIDNREDIKEYIKYALEKLK